MPSTALDARTQEYIDTLASKTHAGFLNFDTIEIMGWIVFVVGNCFVHRRMFSSVPGLSMSVTTPASRHCQKSQTFDKRPSVIKIAHVEREPLA